MLKYIVALTISFGFVHALAQTSHKSITNNISYSIIKHPVGYSADPYDFNPDLLPGKKSWKAKWIWVNDSMGEEYHRTYSEWIKPEKSIPKQYRVVFKSSMNVPAGSKNIYLYCTADVRFRVYINTKLVHEGPISAGSDYEDSQRPSYWYYNVFDIAKFVNPGINQISVEVFSWAMELSEITTTYGGFICQVDVDGKPILTSDTTWKAIVDTSYSQQKGRLVYNLHHDITFDSIAYKDKCKQASLVKQTIADSNLYISKIPLPISKEISSIKRTLVKHNGKSGILYDFGSNMAAKIKVKIPHLFSDTIDIIPFEKYRNRSYHRRSYTIIGNGSSTDFQTPNLAAFRYLLVLCSDTNKIETIVPKALFSTYPVVYNGSFNCSNSFYNELWKVARYTTQLCMADMFFDSPQHQEPIACTGDYFIQAASNYYAFGDPWLTRQNIIQTAQLLNKNNYRMFHTSYSLIWIQMLFDYVRFTKDTSVLQETLPHAYELMDLFDSYLGKDGIVSEAPNYMFMDWVLIKGFNAHHPPASIGMGYMTAFYYKALFDVSVLSKVRGDYEKASYYATKAVKLKDAMFKLLWDSDKQLYRDGIYKLSSIQPSFWLPADSNQVTYSAHVNTLAVLFDMVPENCIERVLTYVVSQKEYELQPYFMSYVLKALTKHRKIDLGLELLNQWKNGIDSSTYTLKENWQDVTATGYGGDYSHAWGGSPLPYLSSNLLGVNQPDLTSDTIRINPYLGAKLTWASGRVPIGNGEWGIVYWKREGKKLVYSISFSNPRPVVLSNFRDKYIKSINIGEKRFSGDRIEFYKHHRINGIELVFTDL